MFLCCYVVIIEAEKSVGIPDVDGDGFLVGISGVLCCAALGTKGGWAGVPS